VDRRWDSAAVANGAAVGGKAASSAPPAPVVVSPFSASASGKGIPAARIFSMKTFLSIESESAFTVLMNEVADITFV